MDLMDAMRNQKEQRDRMLERQRLNEEKKKKRLLISPERALMLREKTNLTQEKFAAQLGLSVQSVNRAENKGVYVKTKVYKAYNTLIYGEKKQYQGPQKVNKTIEILEIIEKNKKISDLRFSLLTTYIKVLSFVVLSLIASLIVYMVVSL